LLAFTTASGCTQNWATCHPTLSSVNRHQKNLSNCPKLLDHYKIYYGSTSGLTAATLRGVEQVVFALPPTLINSSDQLTISLTGLVSNLNAFVLDLTVV
jgi:hypothetical protein